MKCLERTCIANVYNEVRAYVSAIKGFYNECSCTKRGGIYTRNVTSLFTVIYADPFVNLKSDCKVL